MNILDLIKKDHDEALAMIKKLEKMTESATEKTWALTKELVTEVLLHAKAEEKLLYNSCRERSEELRDFTLEGIIEHKLLESTLKRLLKVRPGEDGKFKAALSVVKELLEHHGKEEEEKEIFPKLKKAYAKEELVELGKEFKSLKEELRPKYSVTRLRSTAPATTASHQTLH